jgi:aspartate aminotransferase
MSEFTQEKIGQVRVSQMADGLVGSEIIKLAGEVNQRISQGEKIYNLTIGDFNPQIFPIPERLQDLIIEAYRQGQTNYPAANGIIELRKAVSRFIEQKQGLKYDADHFLIAGGARPLIYACYQALIDPEDKVVFPVPSWNNNHYTHLSRGQQIIVETSPESNFMPTLEMLEQHLEEAALVALCSPLNPTGTVFSKEALLEICEAVMNENSRRRASGRKPLYLLYDQIYWQLTFGEIEHHDPVSLLPELRDYTIFIDGISKAYASTGVRVGWAFGPADVLGKMKSILGHVGAWAPKAEQMATARYLEEQIEASDFLPQMKESVYERLQALYSGLKQLQEEGLPVNAISPQAAIYLTAQFDLVGLKKADGNAIQSVEEATAYILGEAKLAIVPFYAFGAPRSSNWYRLSVGTVRTEEISTIVAGIRQALLKLS